MKETPENSFNTRQIFESLGNIQSLRISEIKNNQRIVRVWMVRKERGQFIIESEEKIGNAQFIFSSQQDIEKWLGNKERNIESIEYKSTVEEVIDSVRIQVEEGIESIEIVNREFLQKYIPRVGDKIIFYSLGNQENISFEFELINVRSFGQGTFGIIYEEYSSKLKQRNLHKGTIWGFLGKYIGGWDIELKRKNYQGQNQEQTAGPHSSINPTRLDIHNYIPQVGDKIEAYNQQPGYTHELYTIEIIKIENNSVEFTFILEGSNNELKTKQSSLKDFIELLKHSFRVKSIITLGSQEGIQQKESSDEEIQKKLSFMNSLELLKFLSSYQPENGDTFYGKVLDGASFTLKIVTKGIDTYEGELNYEDNKGNTINQYASIFELRDSLSSMGITSFESLKITKRTFGNNLSALHNFLKEYTPQVGHKIEANDKILGNSQIIIRIIKIRGDLLVIEKTYVTGVIKGNEYSLKEFQNMLGKGDLENVTFYIPHTS